MFKIGYVRLGYIGYRLALQDQDFSIIISTEIGTLGKKTPPFPSPYIQSMEKKKLRGRDLYMLFEGNFHFLDKEKSTRKNYFLYPYIKES